MKSFQHDGVEVALELSRVRHLARPRRFGVADRPQDLLRRARLDLVGSLAGEELVEDDPERVDIARGRDPPPHHLLGARVVGRHRGQERRGGRVLLGGLGEQLGDAEVENLGHAGRGHQDIGGLQVTVDNEILVQVLHGLAHGPMETEPVPDGKVPLGTIDVERLAGHELHDEVRTPVVRGATVEERRDVRVLEPRKDLALPAKMAQDGLGSEAGVDQLEGHFTLEDPVVPNRPVDRSHAAVADLAEEPVGPDAHLRGERGVHGL